MSRIAALLLLYLPSVLLVGQSSEDLAKKPANPVSSLIGVPFQSNFDRDVGPFDRGRRYTLNIPPVIPGSVNEHWNLIRHTIVPVINQKDALPQAPEKSGLGDTTASLFSSPKEPVDGVTWGLGAVFLEPTATEPGTEKRAEVLKVRQQSCQIQTGPGNYAESPDAGADHWVSALTSLSCFRQAINLRNPASGNGYEASEISTS